MYFACSVSPYVNDLNASSTTQVCRLLLTRTKSNQNVNALSCCCYSDGVFPEAVQHFYSRSEVKLSIAQTYCNVPNEAQTDKASESGCSPTP